MSSNARAAAAPHAVEVVTTSVDIVGVVPARLATEARISFLLHPSNLPTSPREGDPGELFLFLSPLPFTHVYVRCFVPCSAPVCYSPIAVLLHMFLLFSVSGSTLVFSPISRDFHF